MTARQWSMLAAISMIWGASYLLIKIALDGLTPSALVFLRLLAASLLLYAVIRVRGGEEKAALGFLWRRPAAAFVQGFFMVALPFMLISFGELEVPSGLTAVLIAPSPLFVALLAPFLDPSEKVDRLGGLGLLLGFVGVGVLVGVDTVSSTAELLGALAILGAAASYAVGSMNVRLRLGGVPPLAVSFLACVTAAAMTLPPALATAGANSPDLGEVAAVLCLGAVGTAAAFVVYFALIQEVGAGRASLVGYLVPPVALAYGASLLDESITLAAIIGLVLILAGVTLAGRGHPPEPSRPPPEPA